MRTAYEQLEDFGVDEVEERELLEEDHVFGLLLHALGVVEVHGVQEADAVADVRAAEVSLLEDRLQVRDELLVLVRRRRLLLDGLDLFLDVLVVLARMLRLEVVELGLSIEDQPLHVLALTPGFFLLYGYHSLPGGK